MRSWIKYAWVRASLLMALGMSLGYFAALYVPSAEAASSSSPPHQERLEPAADLSISVSPGASSTSLGLETPTNEADEKAARERDIKSVRERPILQLIRAPDLLATATTLWLPREVVGRFDWDTGWISKDFKMDEDAKQILGLDKKQVKRVESTVDDFLAIIRERETQSAKYLINTPTLVQLTIPADFMPVNELYLFKLNLEEVLGPEKAWMFFERFKPRMEEFSSVFTGKERLIKAEVTAEKVIDVRVDTTTMNHVPTYLEHLVHLVEK